MIALDVFRQMQNLTDVLDLLTQEQSSLKDELGYLKEQKNFLQDRVLDSTAPTGDAHEDGYSIVARFTHSPVVSAGSFTPFVLKNPDTPFIVCRVCFLEPTAPPWQATNVDMIKFRRIAVNPTFCDLVKYSEVSCSLSRSADDSHRTLQQEELLRQGSGLITLMRDLRLLRTLKTKLIKGFAYHEHGVSPAIHGTAQVTTRDGSTVVCVTTSQIFFNEAGDPAFAITSFEEFSITDAGGTTSALIPCPRDLLGNNGHTGAPRLTSAQDPSLAPPQTRAVIPWQQHHAPLHPFLSPLPSSAYGTDPSACNYEPLGGQGFDN